MPVKSLDTLENIDCSSLSDEQVESIRTLYLKPYDVTIPQFKILYDISDRLPIIKDRLKDSTKRNVRLVIDSIERYRKPSAVSGLSDISDIAIKFNKMPPLGISPSLLQEMRDAIAPISLSIKKGGDCDFDLLNKTLKRIKQELPGEIVSTIDNALLKLEEGSDEWKMTCVAVIMLFLINMLSYIKDITSMILSSGTTK